MFTALSGNIFAIELTEAVRPAFRPALVKGRVIVVVSADAEIPALKMYRMPK